MAVNCASLNEKACLRNLELLAEAREDRGASFDVTNRASSLAEFLALCVRSLAAASESGGERSLRRVYQARDTFVRAGLEAVAARPWQVGNDWLQIGICPRDDLGLRGELCRQIACLARKLLNDSSADNFFFMNKPPGMRLRFQIAAAASSEKLTDVVHAEAVRWRAERLIDYIEPGVYQPESQLFGGPRSMSLVHALFTIDSLMWLDYHFFCKVEGEVISPSWLVSLATLRTVFAGLDIAGSRTLASGTTFGRSLGDGWGRTRFLCRVDAEVTAELRGAWSRREQIVEGLHPAVKAIVAHHESALFTGAARWRSDYFCDGKASLGPRAAACLLRHIPLEPCRPFPH